MTPFNKAVKADIEAGKLATIRQQPAPMRVFYGAQATDDCNTSWNAIKVYPDGNPIHLAGPFATQELAEAVAELNRVGDDFWKKMTELEAVIQSYQDLVKEALKEARDG